MVKENVPESSSAPSLWKQEDVAFAAAELSREFPTATLENVVSAVASATTDLPSSTGREETDAASASVSSHCSLFERLPQQFDELRGIM